MKPFDSAPPPSPALLEAVKGMKPVSARRPLRTLMSVAAASLAYAALAFLVFPVRRDMWQLPIVWWVGLALVWFAGFVVPLAVALVPRRSAVVPDVQRAVRVAIAVTVGLIVVGLTLTRDGPTTLQPHGAAAVARSMLHCMPVGLVVALAPLLLGMWALDGVVLCGAWGVGAALGAAGGALGGLMLHALCPTGGPFHVGFSHGGAVLVGALIGAALSRLILERRRA
jgi:hypothetical protein